MNCLIKNTLVLALLMHVSQSAMSQIVGRFQRTKSLHSIVNDDSDDEVEGDVLENMWMHERCGYAEVTDEDAEAEPNTRDIDLIRWANERVLSSRSRLGTLAAPRTTAQSPSMAEDVRVIARYALGEPEDPMRGSNQYTDAFASYVRWLNISRPDLVAGGDDAVLLRLSHDGLRTLGGAQAVAARFAIHIHSLGLKGTTLTSALRTMKRAFLLRGSETAESLWSTQSNPLLALANVGCRLSAAALLAAFGSTNENSEYCKY